MPGGEKIVSEIHRKSEDGIENGREIKSVKTAKK
jgi:hypothetical protein